VIPASKYHWQIFIITCANAAFLKGILWIWEKLKTFYHAEVITYYKAEYTIYFYPGPFILLRCLS